MQGRRASRNLLAGSLLALTLLAAPTRAATCTWLGAGENWNTANWSPAAPVAGDDAVIRGDIVLTNATPVLNEYTLENGYTHTFETMDAILRATNITVSGRMTHPMQSAVATNTAGEWVMDARVYLWAYSNVTVASDGEIDADGGGFNTNPSGNDTTGFGPGGGRGGYGGGHGGLGGDGQYPNTHTPGYNGPAYDSPSAPVLPGSGGGRHNASNPGYPGGGAVRVEADGRVTIDGTITANGLGSTTWNTQGGRGSGGSVYITCRTFAGAASGLVRADGGDTATASSVGGSGGGGRIAIAYDTVAQSNLNLTAAPQVTLSAINGRGGYRPHFGEAGTVYLSDTGFWPRTTIRGGGLICVPGFTNWAPASLTVTDAVVRLPDSFLLQVANDIVIDADGELDLRNHTRLLCGGDMAVTNGGVLTCYGGPTNDATAAYGLFVGVTGALYVSSGSYLYPHSDGTNGGSAFFSVGSLTVAASAVVDGDSKGYAIGPPTGTLWGYGPGGGYDGYGGGHGGQGGRGFYGSTITSWGVINGIASAPAGPGSAGGSHNTTYYQGYPGGGLFWVNATGRVTVSGTVTVRGGGSYTSNNQGGRGAGGGIFITCNTFAGAASGRLDASGGDTGSQTSVGGSGGGGRIALIYDTAAQAALNLTDKPQIGISALAGRAAYEPARGDIGTVYLSDASFWPRPVIVDGGGLALAPGFTSWNPAALTISNGMMQFQDGFALTVSGNVEVQSNATLDVRDHAVLACGGNLTLHETALFYTLGGIVDGSTPEYGCLVDVDGDITVRPNAVLYPTSHPTNGGSTLFRARNFTVAAGGLIDGDARGFDKLHPGTSWGYGPGGGYNCYGGSYGGYGGVGNYGGALGITYGDSNAPAWPGSGGGSHGSSSRNWGAAGGGFVWIEAEQEVTVDGTVTCNGGSVSYEGGGGSGGGIYIRCKRFSGGSGGRLWARGGNSGTGSTHGGSGGGGRIAVWRKASQHAFLGEVSVTNGAAYVTHLGEPGTLVWGDVPLAGTLMLVR